MKKKKKKKITGFIFGCVLGAALPAAPASGLASDRPGAVKPGDKITITVHDGATGERQTVSAVVSGISSMGPAANRVERTVVFKQVGTPLEILALDPAARKLSVLNENGQRKVLYVDEATMESLSVLQPGQRIFLSYRFNEDGKAEAIVRPGRPTVSRGTTASVVATDPSGKTLTIREAGGSRRTYGVEKDAAKDLRVLGQGDTVLVGLRDEKVVAITRKN
jgi:hypothetical protein